MEPVARLASAGSVDAVELAAVAARTFPLACPPSVTLDDIASFIDANLSDTRFSDYLSDPARQIWITTDEGAITGYAMLIDGVPDDSDIQRSVTTRPAVELSKMYVLPAHHGSGAATALMDAAIAAATNRGAGCMWLGVNRKNSRAQRFYRKSGFTVSGFRSFQLGCRSESDFVMVRLIRR